MKRWTCVSVFCLKRLTFTIKRSFPLVLAYSFNRNSPRLSIHQDRFIGLFICSLKKQSTAKRAQTSSPSDPKDPAPTAILIDHTGKSPCRTTGSSVTLGPSPWRALACHPALHISPLHASRMLCRPGSVPFLIFWVDMAALWQRASPLLPDLRTDASPRWRCKTSWVLLINSSWSSSSSSIFGQLTRETSLGHWS